jgi:predicted Rossmann fold nucleotide-binding protein DprA/Smf involved in DNA uptake
MGLASATRKIQQVADTAEKLYEKLNELRVQVQAMRTDVTETRTRVESVEHQVERQAVLLDALAQKQGIDVDQLYAEAAIEEAETDTQMDSTAKGAEADGDP